MIEINLLPEELRNRVIKPAGSVDGEGVFRFNNETQELLTNQKCIATLSSKNILI